MRDQDGGAALSNADFRDILSQKKRKTVFKSQIGRLLDRKINESFPLSKIEKKAGTIFTKFFQIFYKIFIAFVNIGILSKADEVETCARNAKDHTRMMTEREIE